MAGANGDGLFDRAFPVYTLGDLVSFKLDPAKHIAGDGFLRRGGGCLLVSYTGMGKSVLAEQIAVCVAAGKDILPDAHGEGGIRVKEAQKVLIVEAESDDEDLARDIPSIVDHIGASSKLVQKNLVVRNVFGLTGEDFGTFLAHDVEKYRPKLIVIDPYQSYVGGVDMNDTKGFLKWVSAIDDILKGSGCAVLLVCHMPKPSEDRDSWDVRFSVYSAFGTSAIANWARTSCELYPLKSDPRKFRLRFSKNARRTGLRNEDGSTRYDIYIEHSDNYDRPCWSLSDEQMGDVKINYREVIGNVCTEHPDWSVRQVSEFIGCSKSLAAKYFPREDREDKPKRRAHK